MKLPSFFQWTQLFRVFSKKEKVFFTTLIALAFSSAIFLGVSFYLSHTKVVPAYSGSYTEGLIGQPAFINPIYGETNDIDRALIDLVYSGLMTYDKEGSIVNDLVENYQISNDGTTYTFELKENLLWQDNIPLTSDDVIYTIKTIQDPEYASPLRANWLGVTAEKISDKSFSLSLGTPYNSFLENATVKIIPQHIWKNVLPQNFKLSPYNLQPVGSGPYTLKTIEQNSNGFIKRMTLSTNLKYYGEIPHIPNISFSFFENENELIKAANQKTIDGFSASSLSLNEQDLEGQIKQGWGRSEKFNVYSMLMPRYFAVFFNTDKSRIMSDKNITQALNYAVNKQELLLTINQKTGEKTNIVNSPILPDYFGYSEPAIVYDFNLDTAKNLLDKTGYKEQENETQGAPRAKTNDKKPSFQFKNYLKIGSAGDEVTQLQGCLAKLDDSFKDLLQDETNGKYGEETGAAVEAFQKKYLPDVEPTAEAGPSTRKKLNELCFAQEQTLIPLRFTLVTINQPQMVETANLLKAYWQQAGAEAEIKSVDLPELKEIIKNRDYDALLYGQALSTLPDLYPFWHSTQINDPGLNLSLYQNKNVDQLLKEARETLDESIKQQDYQELQDTLLADAPALFLYNPNYIYWVSDKIKGIESSRIVDPAKRFEDIQNWYINTRRVWH